MEKDFQRWHKQKSKIHEETEPRLFFHEREIWFCRLGANIGFEQDGHGDKFLRPVIIFRKFNNEILWAIPITRTDKEGVHYFKFSFVLGEESTAILSQLRLIDAKRLIYKTGDISETDFIALKEKLKALMP